MEKILYVYRITNLINNKKYIGKHSSETIENSYYGSGIAVKQAIKKHGKCNFKKEIICICENEKELNEKEIFYIEIENTYNFGYNMTKGGEGMLGYKPSKETIKKASDGRKEHYKNNPEAILKIKERGRLLVGEKNPFFGKKLTKEHIEKMRVARIKAITGKNNPSAVKIKCVELDIIFDTCTDAAKYLKMKSITTILKCAKGQRKKAGGYTWEIIK